MTNSIEHSGSYLWRLALLLLVVLPFLPELIIYAVMGLVKLDFCIVGKNGVCYIARVSAADIVANAVDAGVAVSVFFGLGVVAVWLKFCYSAIRRGWISSRSRQFI